MSDLATRFDYGGWLVLANALRGNPYTDLRYAAVQTLAEEGKVHHRDPGPEQGLDEGEGRRYLIADTFDLITAGNAHILRLYCYVADVLSEELGIALIPSPYYRSGVTFKAYRSGEGQGRHRDTNPFTALIYLTEDTNPDGDPTVLVDRQGVMREIEPSAGSILLMAGRELSHWVPFIPRAKSRVVAAFNYYTPGDVWRPPGTDDLVYG